MRRPVSLALVTLLATATAARAQLLTAVLVEAGDADRREAPASIALLVPESMASGPVQLIGDDGAAVPGQLTAPGLLDGPSRDAPEGRVLRVLHFLTPALDAGESRRFEVAPIAPSAVAEAPFRWDATHGGDVLSIDAEPVLHYIRPELDESSPEAREASYKPFHHLFAPDGRRVTKGAGGRFTHHRGLFFGYNRASYGDGKSADVWHCRGDAFQSHEETLAREAGPVLGRHRVRIDWHGQDGEVFAREAREVTAYATSEGRLFDFASRVEATGGPVKLDGDPQHAGVHVRADNQVAAETSSETYYLRPDGKGDPGATRNWEPKTGEGPVNLPWNAMSIVLDGDRYTLAYLDHPANPKEARYSERDYGRFGSYFEYTLTEDRPLEVRYRIALRHGELTGETAASLDRDFDDPPVVRVVD